MKESIVKSYDELPLFLNAEMLAKALVLRHLLPMNLCMKKTFLH